MNNPQTYGWDWRHLKGSHTALKWIHRDLTSVDAVLPLVPGRRAVVQAGGNVGLFPKRLAQEFQTVYTFEPDAGLFSMLQANAPEPNIIKFQAALGEARGLVDTSAERRDGKRLAHHEGLTHIVPGGVVPTLRIDDLGLPVCDLIYLDIEGWELYAVRGAVETIARCRPVVVVEMDANAGFVGVSPEALRQTLTGAGYRHATQLLSDHVFLPTERAA